MSNVYIAYPQTTYNLQTNQIVDISCIIYNSPGTLNSKVFTITPNQPQPLNFDTITGEISGTTNYNSISLPTTYAVNFKFSYNFNNYSVDTSLNIGVNILPQFYYPNYPTIFEFGVPLTIAPVVIFSNLPGITYTLLGNPNALANIGLNLNAVTGFISGTPSSVSPLTTYIIEANNNGIIYDASLNISIQTIPTFSYPQQSYILTQNVPITILPTVSQPGFTYSLECILPFGLSLDSTTGAISGTPSILTSAHVYTVTITNIIGSSTTQITLSVIKEFLAPPVVADYFSSNTFITDPEVAMRRKAEIFKYKKKTDILILCQSKATVT
jgi:hypothetical protein